MRVSIHRVWMDPGTAGPPVLMDVISHHCRDEWKAVVRERQVQEGRKASPALFTAYVVLGMTGNLHKSPDDMNEEVD